MSSSYSWDAENKWGDCLDAAATPHFLSLRDEDEERGSWTHKKMFVYGLPSSSFSPNFPPLPSTLRLHTSAILQRGEHATMTECLTWETSMLTCSKMSLHLPFGQTPSMTFLFYLLHVRCSSVSRLQFPPLLLSQPTIHPPSLPPSLLLNLSPRSNDFTASPSAPSLLHIYPGYQNASGCTSFAWGGGGGNFPSLPSSLFPYFFGG